MSSAGLDISRSKGGIISIACSGDWTIAYLSSVSLSLSSLNLSRCKLLRLDTNSIDSLDTSGAWLLASLRDRLPSSSDFEHSDSNRRHRDLIEIVSRIVSQRDVSEESESPPSFGFLIFFRSVFRDLGSDIFLTFHILGESLSGILFRPRQGRGVSLTSIVHQIDLIGVRAVPVVSVMSFLIGAVIAQQGAFLLRAYGEELLTVNLVGILHLREIGVLLTAILISGRSGSSITAELGTMKMREEMDALQVMGFNSISVLILPRMIALIVSLPFLTLLSDLSGILGAILISYFYVDISPLQFIVSLHSAIDLSTVLSGLFKAPFMALAISLVAFVEGLKVDGSAESLGFRTTVSVVRSIFVVIVIDCFFAIFYAAIDF